MKKTICMTCKNRPGYLKKVIWELAKNNHLSQYELFVNIDASEGLNRTVNQLCQGIKFIKTSIKAFKSQEEKIRKRIDLNTYDVISRAFASGSDINLYIEDDVVISPDTMDLIEWYIKQDLTDIAQLCLCNLWDLYIPKKPELIYKTRSMCGLGFVMTRKQFEKYAEPIWLAPPSWDKAVANYIRTFNGIYNLVPQMSRSVHIGLHGTGLDNNIFQRRYMDKLIYNKHKTKFNYYMGEVIDFDKKNKKFQHHKTRHRVQEINQERFCRN